MPKSELYQLESDEELRVEVDIPKDETITVELKSGTAEVFGSEMVVNKAYAFRSGAKFAIFTYQGCQIMVHGTDKLEAQPYTSKETPMIMYLNLHAKLEEMRNEAEERDGERGPIVMVVGPKDVGKSTLCRMLVNYGVRMGKRPVYVDLDVGQGSVGVPGTVGAMLVERPASIENDFAEAAPLVYHYGHTSPGTNFTLYNTIVSRLADVTRERMSKNRKAEASGVIINTCGWVKGEGYSHLKHVAQAFEVSIIVVLDQERLYNELVRDMPNFVKTIWLPKSGGVVERPREQRTLAREQRVKEYFYGPKVDLFPHSFDVKFGDLKDKIYKIGAPALPDSCMPLGMKSEDNQLKLVMIQPSNARELLNHVLSISFTNEVDEVMVTNVCGFVVVTNVNVDEQKITVLSPQPKPLPDRLFLLSEMQYVDSS